MSEQCTQSTRFSYNQHVMSDDKPRMLFGSPSARHIQGGGGGGKGLLLCTIGLRCPLLHPTLSIPLCSSQVSLRMIAQQSQSQTLLGN